MVHIKDEGSHFDAPIDLVWKYNQSAEEHGRSHHHRNAAMKALSENQVVVSWEQDIEGKPVRTAMRLTILPPTGMAVELLEGPMAGSKFFNYYTPKGDRTEVTVVGDFTSKQIPPEKLASVVMHFLEGSFDEDNEALRRLAGKG